MKQGGRGDEKRGRGRDREGKGGPDEWNKVERDREKRERERERDKPKVDTNRISRLTKRGEKSKEVRTVLCIVYVHNAGMPLWCESKVAGVLVVQVKCTLHVCVCKSAKCPSPSAAHAGSSNQ